MTPEEKKAKIREYNRRYRAKHPERRRQSCRDWERSNPDKVREMRKRCRVKNAEKYNALTALWRERNISHVRQYNAEWVRNNKDKVKAIRARCSKKNAEKTRAYHRAKNAANPESNRARVNEWRKLNPDKRKQQLRRQRYRRRMLIALRNMPGVKLMEWQEIEETFNGRCAYCLQEASSIDHVVALASGGVDEPDNVVPCCRRCNSSKGAKSLLVWLLTSKVAQDALGCAPTFPVPGKL